METLNGTCSQTDPEVWYPETGRADLTRLAKKLCAECIDLQPCTVDAIQNNYDEWGIQAGLTARDRQRLRGGR